MQVYPNPSKGGEFNIYFPSPSDENYSLAVYSSGGELLYETKNLKSNTNQAVKTRLPKGVYLAKISQNSTATTKKIVIE
ncbi:T9SS type A sorting domain-containing protein [Flavobacterium sp.]|uniref:T9SS type A sorting domain-containing protein n=1 Tax=Flavobacterium sp. TaxID=239 RepID=UPI0031E1EA88